MDNCAVSSMPIWLRALLYSVFIAIIFAFSLIFFQAYEYGDQIAYRRLYLDLVDVGFDEIGFLQLTHTGSGEPLYGLVAWVGSEFLSIDKDLYFSIINVIFCLALLHFLIKNSASPLYILLVFLNYYVFVLLAPAERLKVSFLFLMLAVGARTNFIRYGFLAGAILCHFQSLILLGAKLIGAVKECGRKKIFSFFEVAIILVLGFVLMVVAYIFFSKFIFSLISKYEDYAGDRGILAVANIFVLLIIGIFVLKNRIEVSLSFFVCGIAAYILGPDRVNMIAFVIFSYHVIVERRTRHPVVIALMAYFAIKGAFFVSDVFMYGSGFD